MQPSAVPNAGLFDGDITKVATVRQSITALYEESRKSAVEGAPMMAVIESTASGDTPSSNGTGDVRPLAAPEPAAIIARFEELLRLAEIEASPRDGLPEADMTQADMTQADMTQADLTPTAASSDHGKVPASPAVMSDEPDGVALPEEPPAPASTPASGDGADLEIGDIQELVRQAWEDETGIGHAAPQNDMQDASSDADTPSPGPADIEMAMEEIAAAVVQSGDGATPVDVEAMKAELIAAMRAEMKSLLEAELTSAVKATVAAAVSEAVAGALADMKDTTAILPPDSAKPTSPDAPVKKTVKKAAAKKAAGKKSAARKASAKKAAPKKANVVKTLRADPTPDPDDA